MRWMTTALLLVGACTISEENFAESAAGAACSHERRCDKDAFEDRFEGDFNACVDALTPTFELAGDVSDWFGCEYDPAAGSQYVRGLRSLECGSDAEAPSMTDIYDCSGD